MTFRELAIMISSQSYKKDIGWGFDEGESFVRQLQIEASTGRLCGYVLTLSGEPAAYGLCKIEKDIVLYKYTGYADKFARRSPGKVLLYVMLERLFWEGRHDFSISTVLIILHTRSFSRREQSPADA